jgi:predicted aminopeptidase
MEQGMGQWRIQSRAVDNEKVLDDPNVDQKIKDKILKIQEYKAFFYSYFREGPTRIYQKTNFLNRDAVSYLVIASPYDEIRAIKHCFPFVGCFPYLGFFKKRSAEEFMKKLEQENYVTYTRPVYAYSTLGHLNDPILSTFFNYRDEVLAEVIFHEIFHTVFFIEDEVKLNENMANYFGKKLMEEYFKKDPQALKKEKQNQLRGAQVAKVIVAQVKILKDRLKQEKAKGSFTFEKSEAVMKDFLRLDFFPAIEAKCQELQVEKQRCWPLKKKWNQARFTAFLTYEERRDEIEQLHVRKGLDLRDFYRYLKDQYDLYLKKDPEMSFSDFLFETK